MAIMVSNKLTNRRQTARKPPVCRSGPPVGSILYPADAAQLKRQPLDQKEPGVTSPIVPRSGQCPPDPPDPTQCECALIADHWTIAINETLAIAIHACRSLTEGPYDLRIIYHSEENAFDGPPDGLDCIDTVANYSPFAPGEYPISADLGWDAGGSCTVNATVTVKGY